MKLLFSLHILLSFRLTLSFLDLEELKTINYGIDIVDKPILAGQEPPPGAIYLTSKYGQPYQCSYPDRSLDAKKEKEDEKVAMETGIPELLKPMESGPCLVHTKGWWSYEFCYGKEIKQYHMEDAKITGNVIYLGYYESEFNWENSTEKSRSIRNRLNRYHSQQYVNGSKCDLTSTSRRTEVRFQCEDGSGDYIARVDEPETCVYILTVQTTKICHHPYLKPPSPNKPVPITCRPLLEEEEYNMYLEETQVKLPDEEQVSPDPKLDPDSGAVDLQESPEDVKPKGPDPEVSQDAFDQLFMDSLLKGLGDALQEQGGGDEMKMDVKVKAVQDMKDLEKMMSEMLKEAKVKVKQTMDEEDEDEDEEGQQKDDTDAELENEDDVDPIEEFEKELDDMEDNDRARLVRYKENIRSAVEAQFDDILEEAEAQMDETLGTEDKREAFTLLASNLNQLLNKLDTAEKNLARANEALDAAKARKKSELNEHQLTETEGEQEQEEGEEEEEEESDSDFTIEGWDGQSSSSGEQQQPAAAGSSSDLPTKPTAQTQTTTIDNTVRVRVTRIKHQENSEATEPEAGDSSGIDTDSDSKGSVEVPAAQKSSLAETVKSQMSKSGLKAGGSKVHVKIITAGYYDKDDETLHILSEGDSTAFNKMIITILGGDDEEVKEMERQDALESAYSFKWNSNNRKGKKNEESNQLGQT